MNKILGFLAILLLSTAAATYGQTSSLSGDKNYVVTYTPRVEGITSASQINGRPANEVNQTVQYFDGLGRPLQVVQTFASPTNKDIVQPFTYDEYGREAIKYLPYSIGGSYGTYKGNALSEVITHYNSQPGGQFSSFSTPYAKTVFEPSPLNRVLEQGAPGDSWQPRSLGGRTLMTEYKVNTDQNGDYPARRYSAIAPSANYIRAIQDDGYYGANQLFVTVTKDENWTTGKTGTTEEYKDTEGRVVLKRTWQDNSTRLSTYYIYDDLGNLSYVLSPKAEGDNGSITQTKLDELCYQYYYDGKNRLIERKIPGKGWEYLVYNKLDQVVLSQDALQRASQHWAFTKYDALERVVITGIYSRNIDRNTLQGEVTTHSGIAWESLENNGTTGYSNTSFPQLSIAYYQQINYYGTYNIPGISALNPIQTVTNRLNGLLTGIRTYLTDGTASYLTINYYNGYGRVIETVSENHIGGTDRIINSYNDITGELLTSTRTHASSYDQVTVSNAYEYDHMGRRKYVKQNINNNSPIIVSSFDYTETGQLLTKNLGNTTDYTNATFTPANFMQNVAYKYNERGWLKQSSSGLFDMVLNYQENNSNQYNGNISAQNWGTLNNRTKNYSYAYDALNRLLTGSSDQGYSESISSYDKNGNINQLIRTGSRSTTQNYTYDAGNKLTYLNGAAMSYTDNNGNLNNDGARGIGITYNYLNLPQSITGNKTISYTYDAAGRKLKKVSNISGTTDYVNGIQYKNISGTYQIEFVQTEEGRALKNGSNNNGTAVYGYQFTLTDNLGNNRVTFYRNPSTQNLEVLESTDYYPFGLATLDPSGKENKYLYSKKENQEELEEYDYGARFYDPVIARWTTVDPETENDEQFTPYNFTFNNPVRFTDPDGRWPYGGDDEGDRKGYIRNASSGLRLTDPIKAAIVDFSVDVADAFGLNAVDNLVADYRTDPNTFSADNKIELGIRVLQALDPPIGRGSKGKGKPTEVRTYAGQKIDPVTGQKVGGSGQARVVTVHHPNQKRAKDAARNNSTGTPVKHTKDAKGGSHYHHGSGVKGKGKGTKDYGSKAGKVSDNVHHEYPSKKQKND